jgi:long-chain fatty acid transport protein
MHIDFKLKRVVFLIMVLLYFNVSYLYASVGMEGSGIGARALAMGGGFIGLADDLSSVWWNPAGIAQLDKKEMLFGLQLDFDDVRGTTPLGNLILPLKFSDFPKLYPSEPEVFNRNKFHLFIKEPSFVIYLGNLKGFNLALSLGVSSGAGVNWKDYFKLKNNDEIFGRYFMDMFTINSTLTIAREIISNLYIGGNLNILYGKNRLDKKKYYKKIGNSPFESYTYFFKQKSQGYAFSVDGGVLYKPHPKFSLGFLIKSDYDLELRGDTSFKFTPLRVKEGTAFKQKIKFPLRYGIGGAFKPNSNLIITFDWYKIQWSHLTRRIDYDRDNIDFFRDIAFPRELRDTNQYRAGCEYNINDRLSFRLGFSTEPSYIRKDIDTSLIDYRQMSARSISFGFGYNTGKYIIDFMSLFSFSKKRRRISGIYTEDFMQFGLTLHIPLTH